MKIISSIAFLASILFAATPSARAQDARQYADAQGREIIVRTGMPAPDHYGAKPAFAELDRDRDGTISREEAEAFPPLFNDFDFVAGNSSRISPRQYAAWDYR